MGWENLGQSTSKQDRIDAQKTWAKRRNEMLEQARTGQEPGLWGQLVQKLGNFKSNMDLDRAEKRDLSWRHAEKDRQGLIDSPVDTARFNVYEAMLKAAQAGRPADATTRQQWQMIRKGLVPTSAID